MTEAPNAPLVSIAMTSSKSERFIRQQIDSILAQTYPHFELVISHDECGDNTAAILDEYAARDPRVRWAPNANEKGYIKNTESAIALCKGDIIFLCDHDDIWRPERIQLHVDRYRADKDIAWVYDRSVLIDEQNREIGRLEDTVPDYYAQEKLTLLNYAWGTCIGGGHTSYRADVLRSTLPIPAYAHAHDSWIQLMIHPAKIGFVDQVLLEYRQHSGQTAGWNHALTPEEFKQREAQAIAANMQFLRCAAADPRLALWKRAFYGGAYVAKQARAAVRSVLHKK